MLLSVIEQCSSSFDNGRLRMLSAITGGPVAAWSQVSACLPGRNNKSCRKRWIHSLDPTLRKDAFLVHHSTAPLDADRPILIQVVGLRQKTPF